MIENQKRLLPDLVAMMTRLNQTGLQLPLIPTLIVFPVLSSRSPRQAQRLIVSSLTIITKVTPGMESGRQEQRLPLAAGR